MSKIRLSLIAAAVLCFGAVACSGTATPSDPADHTTAATSTPTARPTTKTPTASPTTSKPPTATPKPTDPAGEGAAKKISAEERNAIGSAQDYLETQHFSRKGLIAQLKYEGYSTKAATAAVDTLHTNWNTQAAGVAEDYLNSQHFSRSGLIGQLEYDGFTRAQATYGVGKAGL